MKLTIAMRPHLEAESRSETSELASMIQYRISIPFSMSCASFDPIRLMIVEIA